MLQRIALHTYTPGSEWMVFLSAVIISVALLVAVHLPVAVSTRQEPKDERDRAVESHSTRNAYFILLFLINVVLFTPTLWWDSFHVPGLTHQLLLGSFVAAETVRFVSQVVYYRRGW